MLAMFSSRRTLVKSDSEVWTLSPVRLPDGNNLSVHCKGYF
jgi:hypothetical protein